LTTDVETAVIGAGPYGLAAAAHLRDVGTDPLVFGDPMGFWADHMPRGMMLRSPWNASNIGHPAGALTLDEFESDRAEPLGPTRDVPLDGFVEYGRWFQERAVPDVDRRRIERLRATGDAFALTTDDGEELRARRVVVAAGLHAFAHRPPPFDRLRAPLVLHACDAAEPADFAGRRVAVVGAGQSAIESAALLAAAGADVEVVVRNEAVRWRRRWFTKRPWTVIGKFAYAPSLVGPAGVCWLSDTPSLLRLLSPGLRGRIDRLAMRPEADAPLVARLRSVRITAGRRVTRAEPRGEGIELLLDDGSSRPFDHVVLGTGYAVDVPRYSFVDRELVDRVAQVGGYPVLTRGFESSVPGLHFVGAAAAWSFGPLMRFVAGSRYAGAAVARAAAPSGARNRRRGAGRQTLAATR